MDAGQFVRDRFFEWDRDRLISRLQFNAIMDADNQLREGLKLTAREGKPLPAGIGLPPRDRCWRCNAELTASPSHCPACGVPVDGLEVRQLRFWTYLCTAIKSHCEARRVPLAHTHARIQDAKGRIAVLRATLEKHAQPVAALILDDAAGEATAHGEAATDPFRTEFASTAPPAGTHARQSAPRPAAPAPPPRRAPCTHGRRRPLWEILLDPRSIQWLLALGGALLVVGLVIWQVAPEYYTLTFALAGFVLLIGYRLALWERANLAQPAFQSANALMSLSFVAAALLTLSRMAARLADLPTSLPPLDWSLVILLAALGVLSLLAAWIVRHPGWRRWYMVTAITETALMFLAIHLLNHLSRWEELEIFAVAAGIGLLVVGHVGWYREEERQEDMVSFNLGTGALLVAVPLAIAVVLHRCVPDFSAVNELGMLAAGMLLLATGLMFQIRSTTLAGAGLLAIYLVTLVLYINMLKSVQTAAIWMTIGGAVIFGTGIL